MRTYDTIVQEMRKQSANIRLIKRYTEARARFTCMSSGTDDRKFNINDITEFSILASGTMNNSESLIESTRQLLDTIETMERCGSKDASLGIYLIVFNQRHQQKQIPMLLDWISTHRSSPLYHKYTTAIDRAKYFAEDVVVVSLSYTEAKKYLRYCIQKFAMYDVLYGKYYKPGAWSYPIDGDMNKHIAVLQKMIEITKGLNFRCMTAGLYGDVGSTKSERRRIERITKLRMKWWKRREPTLMFVKHAFTVDGRQYMLIMVPSNFA